MVEFFHDIENNVFRFSLYDTYPFFTSLEIKK